jgi:hypothetical protein
MRSPDKPPWKKPPEGMSATHAAYPDVQPNRQHRRLHGGGTCHGQRHGQGLAHHAQACVPYQQWPHPLSLQTKYPQMQRGTPSPHLTRIHAQRSAAYQRAIQTRRHHGRGLAHRVPHRGTHPPTFESNHVTVTHNGKEASWPHSPTLYISQHPHKHSFFEHQGAFATMRKWHNHHLPSHRAHHVLSPDPPGYQVQAHMPSPFYTGNTRGGRRAHQPSLSAKGEAPHRIPWITHKVRGSVAEIAVGPQDILVSIN